MTIDKRFALLADNGDILFPYIKQDRSGREGFALSAPGERDAKGRAVYTSDLEEVVRRLVFDGWKVRAKATPEPGEKVRDGSYGLAMKVIPAYWLAPELHAWVQGAALQPQEGEFPSQLAVLWPFYKGMPASEFLEFMEASEYKDALLELQDVLTTPQRAMLIGHAASPEHKLSSETIIALGGCNSRAEGCLQHEKLARALVERVGGADVDGLESQIMAANELDTAGNEVWQMRAPLVEALTELGWLGTTLQASDPLQLAAAEAAIAADPKCAGVPATTRQALVNARIGQGEYRRRLMALWNGKCAVTGCSLADVLIASHAQAWASSSNEERLDPFNGLLLSAAVDKLFDRGHISFSDEGHMLTKPALPAEELRRLGLAPDARLRTLQPAHWPYLAAHRAAHGFDA